MKFYFFLFFNCFVLSYCYSQEVISSLVSNPFLKNNNKNTSYKLSQLTLPFIDDFSYYESYVDNLLWKKSSVFVNRTYSIEPPTIGAATFDGLDSNGFAYSINISNPEGYADTLMSLEIKMNNIDSAYFLFYYQPQGLGDAPEVSDSLILEFKNNNNIWKKVWSKQGSSNHDFKKKVIIINSNEYLHDYFQFRFINKATLSGNFDHWNLDYVKIDQFNSSVDTSFLNDVSFVYNCPSFLSRYNEMPWLHFNEGMLIGNELLDTLDIKLRNNNASINVDYQYNVYNNNSLTSHYPSTGSWRNVSVFSYDSIGLFSFTNPSIIIENSVFNTNILDSVYFDIEHIIETGQNDFKQNDTLKRVQKFLSHFSYDDGSAESAYGINVSGARLAYHFKLNRPDTLRAIQMYFPQMGDSTNNIPFKLTIWKNISNNTIIYQQQVFPVHTITDKFHTYFLDSIFQLTGDFYIGWEQLSDDLLNVGLDKNLISNQYMYYNIGSGWTNSQFPGSWMIRPILSNKQIINNTNNKIQHCSIYPNPTSSFFNIDCAIDNDKILVYDVSGNLIFNGTYFRLKKISLSSGVYFINIENKFNFNKLIVF